MRQTPRITVALICAASLLASRALLGAQASRTAEVQFKAAQHTEEVEGDLKRAIEQYRKIADGKDRPLAAKALLRMAECYQKLGDAEAQKVYERIVRDFADQKDTVAMARARLGSSNGVVDQQAARAIWTGPNVEDIESSLSPDGKFITFPHWDTGNLGLHEFATGVDRLLTNTGAVHAPQAQFAEVSAISRDGKQVAYAWYDGTVRRYELRVVSITGGAGPRRVFASPDVQYLEPRDWSPDGKWIAANLWGKQTSQIGLIGVQDGSLRLLKSGTDGLEMGSFSSDGKYLVYTVSRWNPGPGYLISADGNSEVPLFSGKSSVEHPLWTPDGSRIVFVSDRSGSPGLWSIHVAEGKPLGEPERLKADFSSSSPMGFSRDGSLFYGVSSNQTDVYVAGLDPATGMITSEPRRVNQTAIGNSLGRVAWLPDGKALSFRTGPPAQALLVHTLSTGEEREVWRRPGGYTGWFPDGRSVMSRQVSGKTLEFRRVDSRTGELGASWTVPDLPSRYANANAVFSPDLMTMFFPEKDETTLCESAKCPYVMRARDLETGRERELFRLDASMWRPSISHDGREMAFRAMIDNNTYSLMVAPTAGGPPREIYRSSLEEGAWSLAWTQDGAHVLAFTFRGEVWSFPTKGGSPEKSSLRMRSQDPVVSPAGTQVAFVGGGRKSEIWVITGLFPNVRR